MKIKEKDNKKFEEQLTADEYAAKTVKAYTNAVEMLIQWLDGRSVTKSVLMEYKAYMIEKYAAKSVNLFIAAINKFLVYVGMSELKLKKLKIQDKIYAEPERELDCNDLNALLKTAEELEDIRLKHIVITLSASGIRVSELKDITVEGAKSGTVYIGNKGKHRKEPLADELCKILLEYAAEQGIKSGPIFITREGNPIDPSNLSKELKALAEKAGVDKRKVFPHNFRHLFARIFYSLYHDIVRLSDLMGHSSINTTRLYTMESGDIHRQQLNGLMQKMFGSEDEAYLEDSKGDRIPLEPPAYAAGAARLHVAPVLKAESCIKILCGGNSAATLCLSLPRGQGAELVRRIGVYGRIYIRGGMLKAAGICPLRGSNLKRGFAAPKAYPSRSENVSQLRVIAFCN